MVGQVINRGKSVWLVRVFLGRDRETGKRQYHNKTVHGNKKDAESYLVEALRDRNRGHLTVDAEKRTMGALFDDLLDDYRINDKSIDWAEIVVKHLRPFLGKVPISRFSTEHVQRYISHRQAEGVSNGTINREFTLLRRSLNLGRMTTPPKVTRVPRIPRLAEAPPRKGFFEHHAYLAMREALPPEVRPILTFAYQTGCRRAEILSLQWSQVDLLERIIRLEPGETKNDEGRTISLTGELYETLAMQRALRDERYPDCSAVFFRHHTGEPIRDFRGAWECALAGGRACGPATRRAGNRPSCFTTCEGLASEILYARVCRSASP
jgi:integrase